MRAIARTSFPILAAMLAIPAAGLLAQEQDTARTDITVTGAPLPDPATLPSGPEIKGIISARNGDQIQVTTPEGARTVVAVTDATKIKGRSGTRAKPDATALLNGLPVTVKTLQWSGGLVAKQINFRGGDLKTARMIRNGTDQRFEEQIAATDALRGRMADIDKYNIKSTTNVYFDTGKWNLTEQGKAELCNVANNAENVDNALMLVVGYTDSVGDEDYNQDLSEKRANRVINYLQQACRWKPYRMLTPTGMAESDPLASNDTEEGKAQNRRVSVNVLVSKGLDGLQSASVETP
jgi:OmpA-OmpF porin, OOP family